MHEDIKQVNFWWRPKPTSLTHAHKRHITVDHEQQSSQESDTVNLSQESELEEQKRVELESQ